MICNNCKKSNLEEAKICIHCGTILNERNNVKSSNELKKTKKSYHHLVFLVVTCFSVLLVIAITSKHNIKDKTSNPTNFSYSSNYKVDSFFATWLTLEDYCFVFNKNKTFSWYQQVSESHDNYYSGKLEWKRGNEALNDLNLSLAKIKNIVVTKEDVNIKDIYSLKLIPTKQVLEGVDVSENLKHENIYWKFLLIKYTASQAQVFNYGTGQTYYLKLN